MVSRLLLFAPRICAPPRSLITLAKRIGFRRLTAHFVEIMDLSFAHTILAQSPTGQPQQPGMGDFLRGPLVPMLIVMCGFLYIMNRSQKKKAQEHAALLKSVKPGDKVATSGGIVGTIISVREKNATLRSADAKLEITKAAIAEITERGGESKEP